LLFALFGLAGLMSTAQAQFSIAAAGTTYTQDFNGLSQTCSGPSYWAWTDNTTPIGGWYATYSGGSGNFPENYRASNGGSNVGAVYSCGTTDASNSALGAVTSGAPGTVYLACRLVNNSGAQSPCCRSTTPPSGGIKVSGRVREFSSSTEIAGGPSYSILGHDDNSIPASHDLGSDVPGQCRQ
jgi:hypothetical protein